jgi:hypothetical protein
VGAQLVAQRDPMMDQILASANRRTQRDRGWTVRGQGAQSQPVGAQRVGQHKRVEPVVLVARLAVAAAQVLQLVGADHYHRHPGREHDLDDLPVAALDGDLTRLMVAQSTH